MTVLDFLDDAMNDLDDLIAHAHRIDERSRQIQDARARYEKELNNKTKKEEQE